MSQNWMWGKINLATPTAAGKGGMTHLQYTIRQHPATHSEFDRLPMFVLSFSTEYIQRVGTEERLGIVIRATD